MLKNIVMTENQNTDPTQTNQQVNFPDDVAVDDSAAENVSENEANTTDAYYDEADLNLDSEDLNLDFLDEDGEEPLN